MRGILAILVGASLLCLACGSDDADDGGTGGSGGAGGTASGGAGGASGSCQSQATCETCMSCAQALPDCKALLDACGAGTECASFGTCAGEANDDPAKIATCRTTYPSGADSFCSAQRCVVYTHCDTPCEDSIVCPRQ